MMVAMVTTPSNFLKLFFMLHLVKFARLSEDESKVAEVIGVRESVLSRHATGMGRKMVSRQTALLHILTHPASPSSLLLRPLTE